MQQSDDIHQKAKSIQKPTSYKSMKKNKNIYNKPVKSSTCIKNYKKAEKRKMRAIVNKKTFIKN